MKVLSCIKYIFKAQIYNISSEASTPPLKNVKLKKKGNVMAVGPEPCGANANYTNGANDTNPINKFVKFALKTFPKQG